MLCPSPKELALLIVSQRKKLGLSQGAVAARVGLMQKTISAFENHPENVKLSTVFLILSAVNLDMRILPKDKVSPLGSKWEQEW